LIPIFVFIIKKKPQSVLHRFQRLTLGNVGISIITLAELQYGVTKSSQPEKNQFALNQFLIPLEIIEFGIHVTMEFGNIRAYLEKNGIPIGPLDTLIAAHAKKFGFNAGYK